MLKIIKNIINKNCKHKKISCTYEPISEHTNYEYQYHYGLYKIGKVYRWRDKIED